VEDIISFLMRREKLSAFGTTPYRTGKPYDVFGVLLDFWDSTLGHRNL